MSIRTLQAHADNLKRGIPEPDVSRLAVDTAAFESRDFVQEVVLAVSECLADGKSELFALAVVKERFAAPAPPPLPPFTPQSEEGVQR